MMLLCVVFGLIGFAERCTAVTFNAAFKKATTMSSTYDAERNPEKSVDGNSDAIFDNCSSTAHNDLNPWWQVDLGNNYHVTAVSATNREDYNHRLHDFTVAISTDGVSPGTACGSYSGVVPGGATATLSCDQITWGRYVKITKPANDVNDIFTLCEVQVMAIDRSYMVFERHMEKVVMCEATTNSTEGDLLSCVHACRDSADCLAFQYARNTGSCRLFNATAITNNTSSMTLYVTRLG